MGAFAEPDGNRVPCPAPLPGRAASRAPRTVTLPVEQVLSAAGLARALSLRTRNMPLHGEVLRLERELRAALPELVSQRAFARALRMERHAVAAAIAWSETGRGEEADDGATDGAGDAAGDGTGDAAGGGRRAGVPSGWAVDVVAEATRGRAEGGGRVLRSAIVMAEARRGRQ